MKYVWEEECLYDMAILIYNFGTMLTHLLLDNLDDMAHHVIG